MNSVQDNYMGLGSLFLAQVAAVASIAIFSATGGLLFLEMGSDVSIAALPILVIVLGAALFAQLHPTLFKLAGDRKVLIAYLAISAVGLVVAKLGADASNAAMFLAGCALFSAQAANAQTYRFIALRQVGTAREPFAMSTMVIGALVGGITGPLAIMAAAGRDGAAAVSTAPLLVAIAATVGAALLLSMARLAPRAPEQARRDAPATAPAVARKVLGLYACGAVAAATMNLMMIGGPLILRQSPGGVAMVGAAMMFHMIGMYAPSLVAPKLFKAFSPPTILLAGLAAGGLGALFFGTGAAWSVAAGMVLIGVSWNLLYITSGILVSRTTNANVSVESRFNVLILISTAVATACSGLLLDAGGAAAIAAVAFAVTASGAAAVAATWMMPRAEAA